MTRVARRDARRQSGVHRQSLADADSRAHSLADLPGVGSRSLKSQRGQWWNMLLARVVTALLAVTPACGHQSTPVQSPADVTGNSSSAAREFDPATVARLDAAVNDAMHAAAIPGTIIGVWGPQGRYVRAVGVARQGDRRHDERRLLQPNPQ
jgi:hypothetical protein